MLVSWNWLREYLNISATAEEVAERLMMAGLNHEGNEAVGADVAIELEVTSNRPDCLGHLGVAREAAVLFGAELKLPQVELPKGTTPVEELTSVELECPELCPRYTARVIRGVKIKSSPAWMVERLATVGIPAINNVVDITNYVLLECGQPLHAFDLSLLAERRIVVRRARAKEPFTAINHEKYELDTEMCVIADAKRPVALGGVMGGADTEISGSTRDLLIESAAFAPLSIRNTSRRLNLRSDSSYRFERGVDPEGIDWASRRCCQLILELAGGELAEGVIDKGPLRHEPRMITLRLAQIERVLGIKVDAAEVREILAKLGLVEGKAERATLTLRAPSWRRDLTREIDLIEEVARIHGYHNIPEDAKVPMAASHRTATDRGVARVREVLAAAGFDEAMTPSVVSREWAEAFSPWSEAEPLAVSTPMLRGADRLRRSLLPSLLDARRNNTSVGNTDADLFEIANIYLARGGEIPDQRRMLGLVCGRSFAEVKGLLEAVARRLNPALVLAAEPVQHPLLARDSSARLLLEGRPVALLGAASAEALKQFGLRGETFVAELELAPLLERAVLIPQHAAVPDKPAIEQDLNFIVAEAVRWSALEATVRGAGGELLEAVVYRETYRNEKADGPDKKRLLLSITLRAADRTLSGDDAEQVRAAIIDACRREHEAVLVA